MITLYDYALSGNCFKVRLLLKWLGLEYDKQLIDFYPGFEHRSDEFLAINPLGQLDESEKRALRSEWSREIDDLIADLEMPSKLRDCQGSKTA